MSGAPAVLTDDLLPGMRTGRVLSAVAFAHVRRPGAPNPVATRVPGGWRLDGVLDWVTSWDIADVVMVMAQGSGADADRLVCCYLPAGASPERTPGVTPGPVLELLAMSGTHTRPVRLEGVHVPDERVGAVLDRAAWLAADGVRTADASPSAFGVARGAIAELHLLAESRDDDTMRGLVASLVHECRAVRAAAYAAADGGAAASGSARPARGLARPGRPGRDGRGRRPVGCGDAAGVLGRATAARVDVPAGAGPDGGHPAGLAVPHAHARAGGNPTYSDTWPLGAR